MGTWGVGPAESDDALDVIARAVGLAVEGLERAARQPITRASASRAAGFAGVLASVEPGAIDPMEDAWFGASGAAGSAANEALRAALRRLRLPLIQGSKAWVPVLRAVVTDADARITRYAENLAAWRAGTAEVRADAVLLDETDARRLARAAFATPGACEVARALLVELLDDVGRGPTTGELGGLLTVACRLHPRVRVPLPTLRLWREQVAALEDDAQRKAFGAAARRLRPGA